MEGGEERWRSSWKASPFDVQVHIHHTKPHRSSSAPIGAKQKNQKSKKKDEEEEEKQKRTNEPLSWPENPVTT